MGRVPLWLLACSPLVLASCGGGTKTVTATVTAPAASTASVPPAATGASGSTGDAAATGPTGAVVAAPLPDGVLAGGEYEMTLKAADYTGINNITVDDNEESTTWSLEPRCEGTSCSLQMRRELQGGAFKSLTLQADPDRPNAYNATSTGKTACAATEMRVNVRQRYAVKLTAATDEAGRPVGARADAYYSETISGRNCDGNNRDGGRGTVSWRGARTGG